MNGPITGALVVCVAAAGVAAGALFLEPSSDSPAPAASSAPAAAPTQPGGAAEGGYGSPSADAGASADSGAATPAGASLEISGFQFGAVAVAPGGQVTVDNRDGATHTVTDDNGAFDSGEIAGGSAGSLVAPSQPGTYQFHCQIHPDMSGTLTVG